jgi:hypothetical protein
MSNTTAPAKRPNNNDNENNMPERFARVETAQLDEHGVVIRCDSSDDQPAPYKITKTVDGTEKTMFLCAHHTRRQADALLAQGWVITPDTYAFAPAKKAEVKES